MNLSKDQDTPEIKESYVEFSDFPQWVLPALISILILFAFLLSWEITEPWVGHHDYNGAWISASARNHIEQGLATTRLGVILNNDPNVQRNEFEYYMHHPPLVSIFVAVSFKLFGVSEWAARLVPISSSIGTAIFVFLITSKISTCSIGITAVLFYVLMPMNTYFGRMVNHETLTLFFSLASIYTYLRWRDSGTSRMFLLSLSFLVLGMFCGWPAYYMGGFLPLHYLLTWNRKSHFQFKIFCLPVVCVLCFFIHLAHIHILLGSHGVEDLKEVLQFRTSAKTFTFLNLIAREIDRGVDLFTAPLLILACFSLFYVFRRTKNNHYLKDRILPVILAVFGLTHILLFTHGAWVHDYWAYYCAPAIVILAAICLASLARGILHFGILILVVLLISSTAFTTLRSLHRDDYPFLYEIGGILNKKIDPGTQMVWNLPVTWWPWPQATFYARRDIYPISLKSLSKVKEVLSQRSNKNLAFIFYDYKDNDSIELKNWLDASCKFQKFVHSEKEYFIYYLPGNSNVTY